MTETPLSEHARGPLSGDLIANADDRYKNLSWPTPAEEEWRRTDVTRFPFDEFQPYTRDASESVIRSVPAPLSIESAARARFVAGECVDFEVSEELARSGLYFAPLAPGVRDISGDGDAANAVLSSLVQRAAERIDNRLLAWHYARPIHGTIIYVPKGLKLELPIVVEFFEAGESVLANPHVFLAVDEGADVSVIQVVRSAHEGRVLCNAGSDAEVKDNARLEIVSLNDFGASTTAFEHRMARVGRDARLHHFGGYFGGDLTKTRLEVGLDGEGAEAYLDGAYLGENEQHMDIRTVQYHRAPHTASRSFFKGAVGDAARTIFQGLIEVEETATQTDAFLTNRNLVLNDGARADSIPSLKIRTNDVKCSHGSTTGRIDEDQVFYLMSRGFPRSEAKEALVEAYFEEVIERAHDSAHDLLLSAVTSRLGKER